MIKKSILTCVFMFITAGFLTAKTAEELLVPVYADLDAVLSSAAEMEISTVETAGKTIKQDKKNYSLKPGKKQSKKSQPQVEGTPDYYPYCLFHLQEFLENYDLTVTRKDERIKLGKEEIIAVRKGQTGAYPQIRIIIRNKEVLEIRFYSLTGKKYYVVKIGGYEVINGVKMPSEISETVIAQDNIIEKTVKYSKK